MTETGDQAFISAPREEIPNPIRRLVREGLRSRLSEVPVKVRETVVHGIVTYCKATGADPEYVLETVAQSIRTHVAQSGMHIDESTLQAHFWLVEQNTSLRSGGKQES